MKRESGNETTKIISINVSYLPNDERVSFYSWIKLSCGNYVKHDKRRVLKSMDVIFLVNSEVLKYNLEMRNNPSRDTKFLRKHKTPLSVVYREDFVVFNLEFFSYFFLARQSAVLRLCKFVRDI